MRARNVAKWFGRAHRPRWTFEALETRLYLSEFYDFDVIAQTNGELSGFTQFPSINDSGQVAFIANLASGGEGIFVGTGNNVPPTQLSGPGSANTTYLASVQINNAGQVLASQRDFTPNFRSLDVWDANSFGPAFGFQRLAGNGAAGTSIFTFASLPNTGAAVFAAIPSAGGPVELRRPTPNEPAGFGTKATGSRSLTGPQPSLRPMAADNGSFVVRFGNAAGDENNPPDPILLFNGSGASTEIATSANFRSLGSSPGISDDGKTVVFYGDLTPEGAREITRNNGDVVPRPVTPGEGIFLSIDIAGKRRVVRIAGRAHNGYVDPGELVCGSDDRGQDFHFNVNCDAANAGIDWEIGSFDPAARVAISVHEEHGAAFANVVFVGTDTVLGTNNRAIFSSRVNFFGPLGPTTSNGDVRAVGVEAPVLVARSHEEIDSLGRIADLNIFDPLNENGQVAFWASMDTGAQAVLRATPRDCGLPGVDRSCHPHSRTRFGFGSSSVDSPLVEYVYPYGGASPRAAASREGVRPNQIILHATAANETRSIAGLTANVASIHYLVSREGRVAQIVREVYAANHARNVGADLADRNQTNIHSIGIELVDNGHHRDDPSWATETQLGKAALLVRDIASRNGISAGTAIVHPRVVPRDFFKNVLGYKDGFRAEGIPFDISVDPNYLPGHNVQATETGEGISRFSDGYSYDFRGILAHGQVRDRLRGKDDPAVFDWAGFLCRINPGICLTLHSPANFFVTDPLGRHAGVDPATGQIVLAIPGVEYSGPGTEPQTLAIPFAAVGDYMIQVVGTGTGSYTVDVLAAGSDANLTRTRVGGSTSLGTMTTYGLAYDIASGPAKVTGSSNLPPAAFDDVVFTKPGVQLAINVLSNDSDPDARLDPTTVSIVTQPAQGRVTVDVLTGFVTYTPSGTFIGRDEFSYVVLDNAGAPSNVATVLVEVGNLLPIANDDDGLRTNEEIPIVIDIMGNDFDPDGTLDQRSVAIVATAGHGGLTGNADGTITYLPDAGFNGEDTFSYTVCDEDGGISNEGFVTVHVAGPPQPPVVNDDSATTDPSTPVEISVLANDSDPDGDVNPATVIIMAWPGHGTVNANPITGSITYRPDNGFLGSDRFTYSVQDFLGLSSGVATVTVAIAVAPPAATDDAAVTDQNRAVSIAVLANDRASDGMLDLGTLAIVTGPNNGTAAVATANCTAEQTSGICYARVNYQPQGGFIGTDTFTYQISNTGGATATAMVTVTVQPPVPAQPPGLFSGAVNYKVGGYPNLPGIVEIGDFTGDRTPDLVTMSSSGFNVFPGMRDGTFQAPIFTMIPAGFPTAMASGDYNGDGKFDLLVGFITEQFPTNVFSVQLLLGQGDGTFQPTGAILAAAANPFAAVAKDLNGDGKLDAVVLSTGPDLFRNDISVSVFLGNGNGTFRPTMTFSTHRTLHSIVVHDFNRDGKSDLAASADNHSENGAVVLWLGKEDGTFQQPVDYPLIHPLLGLGSYGVNSLASGDFNGDGKTDLAASTQFSDGASGEFTAHNTVNVLFSNGDGTFQPAVDYVDFPPAGDRSDADSFPLVAGDFDGDGKTDLATGGLGSHNVSVMITQVAGAPVARSHGIGTGSLAMVAGDLNGDGRTDLVSANENDTVSVMLANADGRFSRSVQIEHGLGKYEGLAPIYPTLVIPADVNGDAKPDVIVGGSNVFTALLNNGDGTFQAPVRFDSPAFQGAVAVGDFNGDRLPDLAVASVGISQCLSCPDAPFSGGSITILQGSGDGRFSPMIQYAASDEGPFAILAADFNKDGAWDLATTSYNEGKVNIRLGNGDGTFRTPLPFDAGVSLRDLTSADFDQDGNLDLWDPLESTCRHASLSIL